MRWRYQFGRLCVPGWKDSNCGRLRERRSGDSGARRFVRVRLTAKLLVANVFQAVENLGCHARPELHTPASLLFRDDVKGIKRTDDRTVFAIACEAGVDVHLVR